LKGNIKDEDDIVCLLRKHFSTSDWIW